MRGLSVEDFGDSGLNFLPDGKLLPVERASVTVHELVVAPD